MKFGILVLFAFALHDIHLEINQSSTRFLNDTTDFDFSLSLFRKVNVNSFGLLL